METCGWSSTRDEAEEAALDSLAAVSVEHNCDEAMSDALHGMPWNWH